MFNHSFTHAVNTSQPYRGTSVAIDSSLVLPAYEKCRHARKIQGTQTIKYEKAVGYHRCLESSRILAKKHWNYFRDWRITTQPFDEGAPSLCMMATAHTASEHWLWVLRETNLRWLFKDTFQLSWPEVFWNYQLLSYSLMREDVEGVPSGKNVKPLREKHWL